MSTNNDPAITVSKKSMARAKLGLILFLIIIVPTVCYFIYGMIVPNHKRAIEGMNQWASEMIPAEVYTIHNKACKKGDRDGNGKISCQVSALNLADACDLKIYELQCTSTWWWQDWISDGCSGGSSKDN